MSTIEELETRAIAIARQKIELTDQLKIVDTELLALRSDAIIGSLSELEEIRKADLLQRSSELNVDIRECVRLAR